MLNTCARMPLTCSLPPSSYSSTEPGIHRREHHAHEHALAFTVASRIRPSEPIISGAPADPNALAVLGSLWWIAKAGRSVTWQKDAEDADLGPLSVGNAGPAPMVPVFAAAVAVGDQHDEAVARPSSVLDSSFSHRTTMAIVTLAARLAAVFRPDLVSSLTTR
ncbi:hypothetical protein ColKHC_09548 [Colletotrichum higginsianum]|nr:hypothetical protein ColKHC_09548 [Colletotrichum higginsianum]